MLEKWKLYQATEVLTGKDSNGGRLISLFASDYKKIMHSDICPACNGFEEKFKNFIKKLENMKTAENKNSGFILKPMYDNITLCGRNVYFNNENLTNEMALELIENHPHGVKLFSSIPENYKELKNKKPATSTDASDLELFGKKLTIEEVKELFKSAKIETKATSIKGFEDKFNKLKPEQKATLEALVNPVDNTDLEARFKTRVDSLTALGFVRVEDNFEMEDYDPITADDVYNLSDEEFDAIINE